MVPGICLLQSFVKRNFIRYSHGFIDEKNYKCLDKLEFYIDIANMVYHYYFYYIDLSVYENGFSSLVFLM